MYHGDTSFLYFCNAFALQIDLKHKIMEPRNFKESNLTLTAPGAMPDCEDLPVYTNGKQCVSCWKASWKERIAILFTGRVWLGVVGHRTQPPVWITGNDPFYKPTIIDNMRAFIMNIWSFLRECGRFFLEVFQAIKDEKDKRKHFIVGAIIAFVFGSVAGILFGIHQWSVMDACLIGAATGFTIGSVAGIAKEVFDKLSRYGKPERMDWYATVIGSVAGSIVSCVLIAIVSSLI